MSENVMSLERQHQHLQNVSRTFALTIPLLPECLTDCISNCYLLCRIADTIEDDPLASTEKKIAWLKDFAYFASNGFKDEMTILSLHKQAVTLVEKGAKPQEFDLIKDMPAVIARTVTFNARHLSAIKRCVSILCMGMARELKGITINSLDDVDTYCYYVAGVVGEALAALFSSVDSQVDEKKLMSLSVSFGEGLQLTNILKDRLEDAQRGASFLPAVESEGVQNQDQQYIALTLGHLTDALNFTCCIPSKHKGIRFFCYLNIAMAVATLRKIRNKQINGQKRIKISRKTVKTLFILSKIFAKSNVLLRILFAILSTGLPKTPRNALKLREKVSYWEKDFRNILE